MMPIARRLTSVLSVVGFLAVALGFVSGYLSLVETHGNSMAPRMATGDLVIVRQSPYGVGDVVAYHSEDLRQLVLHRVIAVEGDRFSFQGDNNDFVDPEEPARGQLIGKELLHIPQGGVWLDRLTSPTALGLLAFGVLAAGGAAAHTRRSRRRRITMSQRVLGTRKRSRSMTGLPAWARRGAAAAGLLGVAGIALGVAAWTTPTTTVGGTPSAESEQTMRFSYSAKVPKSPAYDGTTVSAPDPVFRMLTDNVEIEYSYRGDPGSIAVTAELSTASGWHSTVPLGPSRVIRENGYTGTVSLNLRTLERRAEAAAEATGIPAPQVDIALVPRVTTTDHKTFAPQLALTLTPLQLMLAGGESTLSVGGSSAAEADASDVPALSLAGRHLPVSTSRTLSLVMLLAALLIAGVVGLLARKSAPVDEAAAIHRRYAQMLVEVEPMPAPTGRPVIDVVDFTTLAKLAERYELLVLHWSRSEVETFIVQDNATTYRYRTGSGISDAAHQTLVEKA